MGRIVANVGAGAGMLEGRKRAPAELGSVLVLGLGKSGRSAARYCAELIGTRVERLFVAAGAPGEDARRFLESLKREGFGWAFGDEAAEGLAAHGERFDVCIASPGIPFWHDLYVAGRKISRELISEVEFAWRESAADSVWVGVTGTNGKTTTTSLCAHILRECGFNAEGVGNIGEVCLDAVSAGATDVYVAELSSYQLASTRLFAPDVAVQLNITPDHLHWHRSLEAYAEAKFKLLDNLGPGGVALLDAANDVVRAKVRQLKALGDDARGFSYVPIGTAEGVCGDMRARCGSRNAAFLDGGETLAVAFDGTEHRLLDVRELKVKGLHNASNALAAAAAAVVLGADDSRIASALKTFCPLEHRIEPCGSVGGVECYNDSKATNVDAAVKALGSFPGRRVAVLLGGDDKGTDLADLVEAVYAHAKVAVCFGEGGPRIARALREAREDRVCGDLQLIDAVHLADAFDAALAATRPGDVVLLSPACASFDEFSSFEHRGRAFKRLVATRADG